MTWGLKLWLDRWMNDATEDDEEVNDVDGVSLRQANNLFDMLPRTFHN